MHLNLSQKIDAFPKVLRQLCRGAGMKTLRSAARAIEQRTGVAVDSSMLSRWERGAALPSIESLLIFLDGLGLGLADLERALEEGGGGSRPPLLLEPLRRPHQGCWRWKETHRSALATSRIDHRLGDATVPRRWPNGWGRAAVSFATQELGASNGRAVSLPRACRFVWDRHREKTCIDEGLEHPLPELGAIRSSAPLHERQHGP